MKAAFFYLKNLIRFPINVIKKNKIHMSVRLSSNIIISRSKIGRGTYIACNTVLNFTEVGNYSSIAPGVQIGGMEHSYWWLSTSPRLSNQCISNIKTIIGNDVWIGAGTIVKKGVRIGDGAVVGAMSFVNKDVPENSIFFGIPAKFYQKRLPDELFEKLKDSKFWLENQNDAKSILLKLESEKKDK